LVNFFPVLCITSSSYSLVCISIERRKAIVESFKTQMTLSSAWKMLTAVWIFAICVSIPSMYEFTVYDVTDHIDNSTHISCGSGEVPKLFSTINAYGVLLTTYIIPLICICTNYTKVALFVWKKGREIATDTGRQRQTLRTSMIFNRRVRVIKMLILVAGLFAVSWLPYFVSFIIAVSCILTFQL
jgi:hypothetical protein